MKISEHRVTPEQIIKATRLLVGSHREAFNSFMSELDDMAKDSPKGDQNMVVTDERLMAMRACALLSVGFLQALAEKE